MPEVSWNERGVHKTVIPARVLDTRASS